LSLTVHVHLFAWWLKVYVCGFYTHTYIYWSGTRQASQLGEIEELRQVWKLHFLFVESGSKKLKALTVTNCVRTEGFEANIKQLRSTPPVRPILFLGPPPPPAPAPTPPPPPPQSPQPSLPLHLHPEHPHLTFRELLLSFCTPSLDRYQVTSKSQASRDYSVSITCCVLSIRIE
jgi:hypothetical protein